MLSAPTRVFLFSFPSLEFCLLHFVCPETCLSFSRAGWVQMMALRVAPHILILRRPLPGDHHFFHGLGMSLLGPAASSLTGDQTASGQALPLEQSQQSPEASPMLWGLLAACIGCWLSGPFLACFPGSYECGICGKKYKYYNCFQTHVRAHRGEWCAPRQSQGTPCSLPGFPPGPLLGDYRGPASPRLLALSAVGGRPPGGEGELPLLGGEGAAGHATRLLPPVPPACSSQA